MKKAVTDTSQHWHSKILERFGNKKKHITPTGNLYDRFWKKVSITANDEKCWNWNEYKDQDGYGIIAIQMQNKRAHRISYFIANGHISDDLVVCHKCDNPSCVNPKHLFEGTVCDNNMDAKQKGRLSAGDNHPSRKNPASVLRGEKAGLAKLTDAKVLEIRKLYATGNYTLKKLAPMYGVCFGQIGYIVNRKTWKHI